MTEQFLEFNCQNCKMFLHIPDALEMMTLENMRKFFKFMGQEPWRNEESTRLFFSAVPDLVDDLKADWDEASIQYQRDYKSPDFDDGGNFLRDGEEKKKRRAHNEKLLKQVQKAKSRYERFQRRVPKLKDLQDIYEH